MNHRRFVEETTPMAHGTQGPKELQGNSRKYHTKWTGTYAAVEQDGSSGLVFNPAAFSVLVFHVPIVM